MIRKLLAGVGVCALLTGCTVTPGGTPPSGLEANVISDLNSTAALAKANSDTNAYNCDEGLITVIGEFTPIIPNPIIVQPTLPPGSVEGLFYKAEETHIAAVAALNAAQTIQSGVLTPTQKQQLETACGPFIVQLQLDQAQTVADLAGLIAKIP